MAPTIERVTESFLLGEGPHWDIASQSLYMVDILNHHLIKYNRAKNSVTKVSTGLLQPSFIIPVEGKSNEFVISANRELKIISWDGESDEITILENLGVVDNSPALADNKFNDGKCDSTGRLWAGTMNLDHKDIMDTPPIGSLFSLNSKKEIKSHANKIRIANGIAFNNANKKMFYIDSLAKSVDRFDYDSVNGTISNREVWFSLEANNIPGVPDGQTIDSDGNLWVAVFRGNRVIKVDGHKPETLLDTITLPALQITSAAFGGPNLDELYVTSGAFSDRGRPTLAPPNGSMFKVTGLGIKGLPAANFKLH